MAEELVIKQHISIHAPSKKVWEVLISPQYIRQYMYGCDAITDWKVGSPLVWKGASDGKVYVKGEIVTIEQNKVLAYTILGLEYEDIPSNYLLQTWELHEKDGITTLLAKQTGFEHVKNGKERYEHSRKVGDGDTLLQKIKELAEK